MKRHSLLSASAAMAAALSMAATPTVAAELPAHALPATTHFNSVAPAYTVWDADSQNVQRHRYRDRYRGRYRNGVDAGDVVGGLLILGTIAAVASAASQPRRERSYPYRTSTNYNRSSSAARGIDSAANMCVREIERDVRVDSVDSVERSGSDWRVSGSLYNGDNFICQIGPDGRIDDVTYNGRGDYQGSYSSDEDRQWTDDRYSSAWNNAGPATPDNAYTRNGPTNSASAPAYPGGPLPGESYDDSPEDNSGPDDRYGS